MPNKGAEGDKNQVRSDRAVFSGRQKQVVVMKSDGEVVRWEGWEVVEVCRQRLGDTCEDSMRLQQQTMSGAAMFLETNKRTNDDNGNAFVCETGEATESNS